MNWTNFLNSTSTKTAIIDQTSERVLSYNDLKQEVSSWVQYLESLNLDKGERVAYLSENSLEHLTIFFACTQLELIFVPLNFRLTYPEVQRLVDIISPSVLFLKNNCHLQGEFQKILLDDIKLKECSTPIEFTVSPKQTSLILFTSGSTGSPKGVLQDSTMLMANINNTVEAWGLKESDKTIIETPFFHTGAYNVLCLPLLAIGGTVVLAKKFEVENFYKTLAKEKLTVYFGVPTMFRTISEQNKFNDFDFSSLRFLISGGAACTEELIEQYQSKNLMFKQGFGLTEVGPNCFVLNEEHALTKIGSIGKPIPNSQVRIIDEKGHDLPANEIGELLLKGDHMCQGFFAREKDFKNSLLDGFYKTGDLALRDEDGFFYIKGRKKEMYISGGENVYPAEVEAAICQHQDILDAYVVSVPDVKWGEVGFAFIKAESTLDLTRLREYLDFSLSRYKHPHYLENVESFPLLDNGKIDKKRLTELAQRNTNAL